MISPPTLAAIIWQRRNHIPWTAAYAALVAAAIYALLRIPINEYIRPLPFLSLKDPNDFQQVAIQSATIALTYGTIRESVRWLIMRHPAARMTTWQAGILFGLVYTAAFATLNMIRIVKWYALRAAYELETFTNYDPNIPHYEILFSLKNAPLQQITASISPAFDPATMIAYSLRWGIVPTALNIGISLAILYSVRHRKAWPFFAAIACFATVDAIQLLLQYNLTYRKIVEFIASYQFLSDITQWMNPTIFSILFLGFNPLTYILPALPCLALALYFQKQIQRADT